ncbi:MAG: UDP-N-acetylmuramate dehydrogenase, partial [Acidimicrobiia bacterium]
GSVGGGVRMNAGCHGSEMVDWLVEATVVDMTRAAVSVRSPRDLEMGYRYTNLQPTEVVAEATFSSKPRRREEAEQEIREITRWRRRHQPGGTLNAGSVFKNPPGDAAGRIIDELGLKGFRVGGAAVSEKHANFFVADPGASSQEVYDLVWAVRRKVGEATGIWLEPEVRFVGEFRPSGDEGR